MHTQPYNRHNELAALLVWDSFRATHDTNRTERQKRKDTIRRGVQSKTILRIPVK